MEKTQPYGKKALYRAAMAYMKPKEKGKMARDIVNRMVVQKTVGTHRKAAGDTVDGGVQARIQEEDSGSTLQVEPIT